MFSQFDYAADRVISSFPNEIYTGNNQKLRKIMDGCEISSNK